MQEQDERGCDVEERAREERVRLGSKSKRERV